MLKNRKFLTVLALVLTLSMVFAMTATATGSTAINATTGVNSSGTLNWPTEACAVSLTGLTADSEACVLVYDASVDLASLTSGDILYIGQVTADGSGNASCTFLLKDTDYSDYASRTNDEARQIKVAVGNESKSVRYSLVTLLFKDEVDSIDVEPYSDIFVKDSAQQFMGSVTVTYSGGGTDTIDLIDNDTVVVTGFSTAVAGVLDVNVALKLENSVTPSPDADVSVEVVDNLNDVTEKNVVTFKTDSGAASNFYVKGVASGADIVLPPYPTYTQAGKASTYQCVGWYDGTNLYPAGKTVTVNSNMDFCGVWVQFAMTDPARSIRTHHEDGNSTEQDLEMSGIRWTTYISQASYNDLAAKVDNVYIGSIVTPTAYLSNYDLEDNEKYFTLDKLDASTESGALSGKGQTYWIIISRKEASSDHTEFLEAEYGMELRVYNVALVNVKKTKSRSARSFIQFQYSDNSWGTFYASYNTAAHSGSAKSIATAVKGTDYYSGLTNGQYEKAIIDAYADAVE